jgi:hypothetical protein
MVAPWRPWRPSTFARAFFNGRSLLTTTRAEHTPLRGPARESGWSGSWGSAQQASKICSAVEVFQT